VPPSRRQLARPPADRYRPVEQPPARRPGSAVAGIALGAAVAAIGALVIVALAGVLAVDVGLLVVAPAIGRFVALAVGTGAGDSVGRSARITMAITLTVAAIAAGQLATWQYARSEGGVLGFVDYLGQVFGVLVPLEFVLGAVAAWWSAR
jgi:hypothetical protein